MAGVVLHQKVIATTYAEGDRDHIPVLHVSYSDRIPDRTDYLLGITDDHPGYAMAQIIWEVISHLNIEPIAVGVPCNTFHASEIFTPFTEQLHQRWKDSGKSRDSLQIINMLIETRSWIKRVLPEAKALGLLSTTGTRKSKVYQAIMAQETLDVQLIPEELQDDLHQAIYNSQWGLKACYPPSSKAIDLVEKGAEYLRSKGVDGIILGCTELPLAFQDSLYKSLPLIDPMTALAKSLVKAISPQKVKES